MARLVVITHEFDKFTYRRARWPVRASEYLLFGVLRELETLGHSWRVAAGPNAVSGDVALLHVDCTIVDEAYLALRSNYARTINFGTGDISKRKVSSVRVAKGDSWHGPVIVKANLNARGSMERKHNRLAEAAGQPLPHPDFRPTGPYTILDQPDLVDDQAWSDPDRIVERFLPEQADDGYVIRTWVFMGSRERCHRQICPSPIVKAAKVFRYEPAEVPEEIRAERERLKFDFGKFDFVVHDQTPILLDTNRTPGSALPVRALMKAGARNLAEGLDGLITGKK